MSTVIINDSYESGLQGSADSFYNFSIYALSSFIPLSHLPLFWYNYNGRLNQAYNLLN